MKDTTRANRRRTGQLDGMTLVELLVVIVILALLVGLVVGVGGWIRRSAQEKQTVSNQRIVIAAIEAYFDTMGDYPADVRDPADEWDGLTSCALLATNLTGVDLEDDDPEKEKIRGATMDILRGLPEGTLRGNGVVDGFGNAMRYNADGGLGGRPVLISAGPDGGFEDLQDKDNIRSDNQ